MINEKYIINTSFGTNKTPVEVTKEEHLEELILEIFFLVLMVMVQKMMETIWREELKNINRKYYCSNYFDVNVNKYGVESGTSLWS